MQLSALVEHQYLGIGVVSREFRIVGLGAIVINLTHNLGTIKSCFKNI